MSELKRASRAQRWGLLSVLPGAAFAIGLVGTAVAGPADGEGAPPKRKGTDANQIETEISAEVLSDYVPRGFSLSSGLPSVQGELNVLWRSFYAGVWMGSVNFDEQVPGFPADLDKPGRRVGQQKGAAASSAADLRISPNLEVNTYVGYQREVGGVEFDAAIYYVAYAGVNESDRDLNYWEFKLGASKELVDTLKLGFELFYSPNYTEETGNNWIFQGKLEKTLSAVGIFTPSIDGSVAYQFGDETWDGFDYGFYNVGMSLGFHEHYKLSVKYHNTFNVPFDCAGSCGPRVVAGLKAEF